MFVVEAGADSCAKDRYSAGAALWGDVKPVVSVKELMKYMSDPVADNIFNAVGSTVTKQGIVDVEPKTEEDWDKIRIGAVSLAEGAYLLKVRRSFTPPECRGSIRFSTNICRR
jgi:hypothetical protein